MKTRKQGKAGRAGAPFRRTAEAGQGATPWHLVALAALVLLIAAGSLRRIWGADFWWQYGTGRLVAESGPPSVDVLSFPSAGRPWIEMRWLYCLSLYEVIRIGGFAGAVVLKTIGVAAAFGLALATAATRRAMIPACFIAGVAFVASSQRLFVRPEIVTFLFFALFVFLVDRHRREGGRAVWALPLLQIVWANAHTLFLLGPFVAGTYALVSGVEWVEARSKDQDARDRAKRSARTAAAVFVLTVLACVATPYGVRGFLFPLELLREIHGTAFKDVIGEFRGPFAYGQRYTSVRAYEALLVACLLSALVSARRLDAFLTLVLLPQIYLSLAAIRNLPLFCLASIPFVIRNLDQASFFARNGPARWLRASRGPAAVLFAVLCLAYARDFATDRFHVREGDTNQFGLGLAAHHDPEASAKPLIGRDPAPRAFVTMREGSYLIGRGVRTFIDPRLEVHGEDLFRRYLDILASDDAWREAVSEWDLRAALVDLESPLAARLLRQVGWHLLAFDEVAALFVRDGEPGFPEPIRDTRAFEEAAAQLRKALPSPPSPEDAGLLGRVASPSPYLRVAGFLATGGQWALAEPFARDALRADPSTAGAHATLGQLLDARGDSAGAAREFEMELVAAPGNAIVERLLSFAYFKSGRPEGARPLLERRVETAPEDALAWAMLTKLHADGARIRDAVACARRAAGAAPRNADYRANLGRLLALSGDSKRGIASLRRAARLAPHDAQISKDLAALESGPLRTGR